MNQKQLLFGLNGRIGRAEWWTASIILMLLQLCIGFAVTTAFDASAFSTERTIAELTSGPLVQQMALASLAMSLVFAWPHLALNAKRLHDRDLPVWPAVVLSLLALLSPVQNVAAAYGLSLAGVSGGVTGAVAGLFLGIAAIVFVIGMLVVLAFLDGTPGPNRYGPSPKGLDPAKA